MSTPHSNFMRWKLLVFYIVLSWFAYVPLLISLLGVGSGMCYWPVLPSSFYLPVHLCLMIYIPGHANSSITSIISPSVFISFPICVVSGLYHYFCIIVLFSTLCLFTESFILPIKHISTAYQTICVSLYHKAAFLSTVTFLITYSIMRLNSSGGRSSPHFRTSLISKSSSISVST